MPGYLDLRPDGIPLELRVQPCVLWRATPNPETPDKPKKVPYQIANPWYKASATDPRTWGELPGRHRRLRAAQ
jgi:primase-polymerase (primpol)-like protein